MYAVQYARPQQRVLAARVCRTLLATAQRSRPPVVAPTFHLSAEAVAQLRRCLTALPLPARYAKYARELSAVRTDRHEHYRVGRAQFARWLTVVRDLLPVAERQRDPRWRAALTDLRDVSAWGTRMVEDAQ